MGDTPCGNLWFFKFDVFYVKTRLIVSPVSPRKTANLTIVVLGKREEMYRGISPLLNFTFNSHRRQI